MFYEETPTVAHYTAQLRSILASAPEAKFPTSNPMIEQLNQIKLNLDPDLKSAVGSLQGTPREMTYGFSGGSGGSASPASIPRGSGDFESLIAGVAKKESGGNYKAVNSSSGALGKYQVMPANVASWSKQALGRAVTPQQFLSSPQLQEAVARYKLAEYYKKYGAAGAAQAWYGGEGSLKLSNAAKNRTQAGGYPSINQYTAGVLAGGR